MTNSSSGASCCFLFAGSSGANCLFCLPVEGDRPPLADGTNPSHRDLQNSFLGGRNMKLLWTILMAFALTFTLAIAAGAQDRDDQARVDQNHAGDNGKWDNRNGWEYRTYDRDQHPDGWMQGERAESKYCEGHNGCYTYSYSGTPYYYYRDDNGRMVVRRRYMKDHDDHHDDQH
jgi:hypothetical protein